MLLDDDLAAWIAEEHSVDIDATRCVLKRMNTFFPHMYEIHRARDTLDSLNMSGKISDVETSSSMASIRLKKATYKGCDIPLDEVAAFE